ncbi:MAG TPA: hypothetical protein PKH16_02815 [Aequorivita sp.]|jgi:hypothetical protein|nr:hypothetical protein [Aequorivita sp.]|tara:strand:- start:159765 stop:159971 length:207 start_codon:yes stop_codon:yes gene_type:complete
MAIGYRIVRRKNPQNSAETQYIMQHISKGIVDIDQMADNQGKRLFRSRCNWRGNGTIQQTPAASGTGQ